MSIREKAALGVPVTLGILILYFGTLHSTFFDAYLLPDTAVDRAIPFLPAFVVPYFSYYLLLVTPLFVIHDSQELRDTAFGYALIVFTSCVAFFFWPTAISTSYTDPLIRGLLAVDRPRNACPSLHASLSLFCALSTQRNLQSTITRYGLWTWTTLVIASTLFTKRHAVIDIVAGVIFGWIVYHVIFAATHQTAGDIEAGVERLDLQQDSAGTLKGKTNALESGASGKDLRWFVMYFALAVTGSSIAIWAVAHSAATAFVIGVVITTVSLYLLLRLMHEAARIKLVPARRRFSIGQAFFGISFLISFSALRARLLRQQQPAADLPDVYDDQIKSGSRSRMRFSELLRRIWFLLLSPILIPVSALRFGSATERKIVSAEYALLFLVWSVLLRTFSPRALLLVWVVPLALAAITAGLHASLRQFPRNAEDVCLPTRT